MKNNDVIKFNQFITESVNPQGKVFSFLSSLEDDNVKAMVNDLIECKVEEREEYIEDILLEIGDDVDDEKYNWVKKSLEDSIKKRK